MTDGFWYKKIIQACPNCNYTYTKRKRVYGRRPRDPKDRVEVIEVFDFLCRLDKRKGNSS